MVFLLFSYELDIQKFLVNLSYKQETPWKGYSFYQGTMEGQKVVAASAGSVKAATAIIAQRVIDVYKPTGLVYCGLAGAISPDYNIGDLLIAESFLQHDVDMSALGYKRGEIPASPYRFIKSDDELLRIALSFSPESGSVRRGRVLSGDQFITGEHLAAMKENFAELGGDAVDTEGAAAALCCAVNKLPFIGVKFISDKLNSKTVADYQLVMSKAPREFFDFISHLLRAYKPRYYLP